MTCALALAFTGSAAALGKPVLIGANVASLPSQAAVTVDGSGTAYIAWAGPRTIVSEKGAVGVDSIASAVSSGGQGWAVYASQGKEYAVSFGSSDSYQRPRITHLRIQPKSSHAKPHAGPISTKRGAPITYFDSQPAATTFKVIGLEPGYRLGHSRCKPLNPFGIRQRHSKPCTVDHLIGTFAHSDLKGANVLQFSGRMKGHRLARSSYELRATPKLGPLKGRTVSVGFRIS